MSLLVFRFSFRAFSNRYPTVSRWVWKRPEQALTVDLQQTAERSGAVGWTMTPWRTMTAKTTMWTRTSGWIGLHRSEWGDTPVDVAVTIMFVEYALLYARLVWLTTSSVPLPMTMSEGVSMGQQASNFVNKFITPILRKVTSTKVHKRLCHVIDAERMHGNLQNCNTDTKESRNKSDKPFSFHAQMGICLHAPSSSCGRRTVHAPSSQILTGRTRLLSPPTTPSCPVGLLMLPRLQKKQQLGPQMRERLLLRRMRAEALPKFTLLAPRRKRQMRLRQQRQLPLRPPRWPCWQPTRTHVVGPVAQVRLVGLSEAKLAQMPTSRTTWS